MIAPKCCLFCYLKIGCCESCTEIAVGAGLLHFAEGITEHLIIYFLSIEQKIDNLAHLLVLNLAIGVFINYLRTLLGRDIGKQIGAKITGEVT